jgi:hypothetical protein
MNIFKTQVFLLLLLFISSCTHNFYIPNIHNVPLFQQKKEFHFNLDGSVGNDFQAFEVQTAYSVTDYLGFTVNGFYNNNEWHHPVYEYCKGHFFEGGAGTFIPLNNNVVFETYTGAGFGKSEHDHITSKFNFYRYYLQPSIGYTTGPVDLAISLRLSCLQYNNIHFTETLDQKYLEQIQYINRNPISILLEPALTFRRGWKHAKCQLQLGYSFNLSNPDFPQEHVNASIGFYLTISNKFRKSKE